MRFSFNHDEKKQLLYLGRNFALIVGLILVSSFVLTATIVIYSIFAAKIGFGEAFGASFMSMLYMASQGLQIYFVISTSKRLRRFFQRERTYDTPAQIW